MLESILYNTTKSAIPVIIFLSAIIIIGFIIDIATRKFDINKKASIFGGMLAGLAEKQIVALSASMIKTFFIIFFVCYYTKNIWLYITMIILSEIVYIFVNIKKAVFEIINTTAQLVLAYIINLLVAYRLEISNEQYVLYVQIVLTTFMSIYTIYFFLRNVEETIAKKNKEIVSKKVVQIEN